MGSKKFTISASLEGGSDRGEGGRDGKGGQGRDDVESGRGESEVMDPKAAARMGEKRGMVWAKRGRSFMLVAFDEDYTRLMILAMCGGLDARTEGCVGRGPAFGPLLHTYPDPRMGGGYFFGGLERLFM